MQESDQVLSQAEIDALLSGEPAQNAPAPEPQTAVEAPPPGPGPSPANGVPSSPATPISPGASPGDIADVSGRMVRLEAAVAQMGAGGQGSTQLEETVRQLQANLQELTSQLQAIRTGLQGTVGYAAHENFVCNTCANPGLVAAKLSCTSCGAENWWGWFPPAEG